MTTWMKVALMCALGVVSFACDGGNDNPDAGGGDEDGGDTDGGPTECAPEVTVSGEISADTTWDCPVYVLSGRVFVVNDSTLTIAAGTTIYGDTAGSDAAALIVTRGSQLNAQGTASDPIVFTSGNPEGARASGDWAGVVLLGSATTNDGNCVDDADTSTDACDAPGFLEDRIEGIETGDDRALYGGTDDDGSCGSLSYVRIEFAGRELSPDNELNGLTLGGCGSTTGLSYIQVHRGKDDGIEFFGGTASMSHIVITGASDDSLDFDEGWRGNVQFLVVHQFPGLGDRAFEADNLGSDEDAAPRTQPFIWNATIIGTDENHAMLLREGMLGTIANTIIHSFGSPPDVVARQVDPNDAWGEDLVIHHTFFFDVADFPAEDLDADGVYELARTMDSSLPATRPEDDEGLSDEQVDLITGLEATRLDDDMGLDEEAELNDAALENSFDVDPMIGSASIETPDYAAANTALEGQAAPVFNSHAPDGFGDVSATYAGAIEPGGTDWTSGWTAYPAN
jgi:hypothetical protein